MTDAETNEANRLSNAQQKATNVTEKRNIKTRAEDVTALANTVRRAIRIAGVTNFAALSLGGISLSAANENTNDINDQRYRNTLENCIKQSDQNKVFVDFVTFASTKFKVTPAEASSLISRALKVFPVKTAEQCIIETDRKVKR